MSANRTELITSDPSLSNVQHCALRNGCLKSLAIFSFLYFMSLSTLIFSINAEAETPHKSDYQALNLEETNFCLDKKT